MTFDGNVFYSWHIIKTLFKNETINFYKMINSKIVFVKLSFQLSFLMVMLGLSINTNAQAINDLFFSFKNPPQSAKPIVWWHWVGSNVTKEGITKDLEWMQRVGIGGFQAFDVSIGGGQAIEKKVSYFTPEWLALIKHTAAEANRLGLDMTIVTAAGWSETGGTWVKPAEAMKKLVWSQTKRRTSMPSFRPAGQPREQPGLLRTLRPPVDRGPRGSRIRYAVSCHCNFVSGL